MSYFSVAHWVHLKKINGTKSYSRGRIIENVYKSNTEENGNWSYWKWDSRKFEAKTSAGSHPPLYYTSTKSKIVFATSAQQVAKINKNLQVDPLGATQVLLFGHCLGEQTSYKNVRVLPPGANFSWQAGKSSLKINERQITQSDYSYKGAINTFLTLFDKSVMRRIPFGKFAMGLSGGRDSRHILLTLLKNGFKPEKVFSAHHYLNFSGNEIDIAKKLSNHFNVPIDITAPQSCRISAEIEKNKLLDYQTLSHSWGINTANKLSTYTSTYDGLNAGVLFGRSGLISQLNKVFPINRPKVHDIEKHVLQQCENIEQTLQTILNPEVFNLFDFSAAKQSFIFELKKFENYPNIAQAFLYFNHTIRDTSLFSYQLNQSSEVLCPFDDIDLVDFALSLPWFISRQEKFQNDALAIAFPELNNIGFTENYTAIPWAGLDLNREYQSFQKLDKTLFSKQFILKAEKKQLNLREIQYACYCAQTAALMN